METHFVITAFIKKVLYADEAEMVPNQAILALLYFLSMPIWLSERVKYLRNERYYWNINILTNLGTCVHKPQIVSCFHAKEPMPL